jgi:hypothetical protein
MAQRIVYPGELHSADYKRIVKAMKRARDEAEKPWKTAMKRAMLIGAVCGATAICGTIGWRMAGPWSNWVQNKARQMEIFKPPSEPAVRIIYLPAPAAKPVPAEKPAPVAVAEKDTAGPTPVPAKIANKAETPKESLRKAKRSISADDAETEKLVKRYERKYTALLNEQKKASKPPAARRVFDKNNPWGNLWGEDDVPAETKAPATNAEPQKAEAPLNIWRDILVEDSLRKAAERQAQRPVSAAASVAQPAPARPAAVEPILATTTAPQPVAVAKPVKRYNVPMEPYDGIMPTSMTGYLECFVGKPVKGKAVNKSRARIKIAEIAGAQSDKRVVIEFNSRLNSINGWESDDRKAKTCIMYFGNFGRVSMIIENQNGKVKIDLTENIRNNTNSVTFYVDGDGNISKSGSSDFDMGRVWTE